MIEWEETPTGLRACDRTKTEVSIQVDGWERSDAGYDIERPLDADVSGYATELRLPAALVTATSLTGDEEHKHGGETDALRLSNDEYLLNIDLNIKTYVQFSGPATIRKTDDFNELHVSFPERTLVTLGFRSLNNVPTETITVPPTPDGVATAVTHLSSAFKTNGPMRTYPTLRGHPPHVELGDEVDVPDAVRSEGFDTDIEFLVPDRFDYAFVAAPLAYYLQADLRVADRESPVLRAPTAAVDREFSELPRFQHEVVATLRRVFFLDCLVRNAGYFSWDLEEMSLLDDVGIDAEETYEATPAERLATYLDAPYERIDDEFPEWHFAMHVAPEAENVTSLPYFLDNLGVVYVPESTDLEKDELLNKSIGDFYRGGPDGPDGPPETPVPPSLGAGQIPETATARGSGGPVKSVDRRNPVLHGEKVNGWLADGVPIDVFKVVPEAYQNRFKYLDESQGDIDVTVILNDEEMVGEHEDAAEIYRERAEDLPIDVTVEEYLSKRELADVLESKQDFVHYIGHCEEDGLRCSNGHLSVDSIEESNVQTFFLNACGSYYEGRDLVRKGSVAGAVTFTKVLNKQAAKVGVSFARLLINGFNIDLALRFARRRIMMGKDYSVVGDGSHVLTQADNGYPAVMALSKVDEDTFEVEYEQIPVQNNGIVYQLYLKDEDNVYLQGSKVDFDLHLEELVPFLERAKTPVIFDGEIYWSNELIRLLS